MEYLKIIIALLFAINITSCADKGTYSMNYACIVNNETLDTIQGFTTIGYNAKGELLGFKLLDSLSNPLDLYDFRIVECAEARNTFENRTHIMPIQSEFVNLFVYKSTYDYAKVIAKNYARSNGFVFGDYKSLFKGKCTNGHQKLGVKFSLRHKHKRYRLIENTTVCFINDGVFIKITHPTCDFGNK